MMKASLLGVCGEKRDVTMEMPPNNSSHRHYLFTQTMRKDDLIDTVQYVRKQINIFCQHVNVATGKHNSSPTWISQQCVEAVNIQPAIAITQPSCEPWAISVSLCVLMPLHLVSAASTQPCILHNLTPLRPDDPIP